jgi:hypothetical protein
MKKHLPTNKLKPDAGVDNRRCGVSKSSSKIIAHPKSNPGIRVLRRHMESLSGPATQRLDTAPTITGIGNILLTNIIAGLFYQSFLTS